MSRSPFLSIVIPTRNRAHLLRYALRSGLEQSYDDYEVVVSNNDSRDDTARVVQEELAHPRVRYVETSGALSMADHWEFALGHARGLYVTYLCDDDAVAPTLLERTAQAIADTGTRLIATPNVGYFDPSWRELDRRNCARLFPHSGSIRTHDSRATLERLFTCRNSVWSPRMLNSFCHADDLQQARRKAGRLFRLCPDFSFAATILTVVPAWTLLDVPLRLFGVAPASIGASLMYGRDGAIAHFVAELKQETLFERTPLDLPLLTNYIAETLLIVRESLASSLGNVGVDWAQYFLGCWRDLDRHAEHGLDVRRDREAFARALEQQPAVVQAAVSRAIRPRRIRAWRRAAGGAVLRWATRLHVGRPLRRRLLGLQPRVIRGADAGFGNILECARYVAGFGSTPAGVSAGPGTRR